MGRPPLPKGESCDVQIGLRLKRKDNAQVERSAAQMGISKPDWIRMVAVNTPRPVWTKCESFTLPDLDRKTVKFRIRLEKSMLIGEGVFFALPHRDGPPKLAVEIQSAGLEPGNYVRFFLTQPLVSMIRRNPDQSGPDFLCEA